MYRFTFIHSFFIKAVSYHDTDNKNIWIHLENCYLVVSNINNDLLSKMIQKKLLFTFVDSEKKIKLLCLINTNLNLFWININQTIQ